MSKYILAIILVLIIGGVAFVFMESSKRMTQTAPQKNSAESMKKNTKTLPSPAMQLKENAEYTAVLHTTEGDITLSLNSVQTPVTVNNFVYLAKKGLYNNTVFHRVMKGFMIQGGDPEGNGTGGPGYRFADEPFEGEYTRGTVAMANAGPDTNGSQFFIMHQNYDLPKDYTIFGKVTQGIEVVDKIAEAPTKMSAMGEKSVPVSPVTVKSVDVIEN